MSHLSSDSQPDDSEHDLAALQGSWEQVDLEADGVSNRSNDHGSPGAPTTFTGNHYALRSIEGNLLLEGQFTLDASTVPRPITWVDSIGSDSGKKSPAS